MARHVSKRMGVPEGASTLPGRYYRDPEILSKEIEHLFQAMWICAGREDEIPNPGDFILRDIGTENILIIRDDRKKIHAFYNVCRHRGSRLCHEPCGSVQGSIQCQYHAWTYGLDGKLMGAPHMNEVKTFDKSRYSLKDVGCEAWDGHLFINLAEDRAPLKKQLGDLPERFARFRMGKLRRGGRVSYDVATNWKLIVENYSECYHCPLIHPDLNRVTHYMSGRNDTVSDYYNGGYQIIGDEYSTLTVEGRQTRSYLKGIDKEDHNRVYYYTIYPNFLLSLHPDYIMTHTLWPKSPNQTHVICEWHFGPEEMARPEFDPSDAIGFWDMTNRQDWRACEITQLGVTSKAYTPGPFSHQEDLLYVFDRFVVDRLEGPPAKPRKIVSVR